MLKAHTHKAIIVIKSKRKMAKAVKCVKWGLDNDVEIVKFHHYPTIKEQRRNRDAKILILGPKLVKQYNPFESRFNRHLQLYIIKAHWMGSYWKKYYAKDWLKNNRLGTHLLAINYHDEPDEPIGPLFGSWKGNH